MKKIALYLFFVAAAAELFIRLLGIEELAYFAKPTLMPLLAIWFWLATKTHFWKLEKSTVIALFFSWLGDIFLMFNGNLYFTLGLGSFLIAHLAYMFAFLVSAKGQKPTWYFVVLFLLIGGGIFYVLYPNLGTMLLPVSFYATAIMGMGICASTRKGLVIAPSFWAVFSGALLFMFSDTCIAVNKFLFSFPWAAFVIMLTYLAGQFLIAWGMAKSRIN